MKELLRKMGPGLLYAGAAVGVSHLVQSTRAGAEFGTQLIWAVLLANATKYPFMLIAPKFTSITGRSLLEGYLHIGRGALWLVFVMTIATMFTLQAAVTLVTAGLALEITGLELSAKLMTMCLLFLCSAILLVGHYKALDRIIKYVIVLLSVTTLGAVVVSASSYQPTSFVNPLDWSNQSHILFLAALMGWMPAPLDISIWHSMWSVAKNETTKGGVDLKSSVLDFNIGYICTIILAVSFVLLGAFVMYGSSTPLSPKATVFAKQLIQLYTIHTGSWAYPVIATAAFATMFSTTLTCLDAFPRVLRRASFLMFEFVEHQESSKVYAFWLLVTLAGVFILLFGFIENMKTMVTMATVLSFILAPVYAGLNYMVMNSSLVPVEHRPSGAYRWLCYISFMALFCFSLWFLIVKF